MTDKIIVHSTYYNPIEASIVKSKLDDSDIPCFLTDENLATLNPLYSQAIGGVKLNVFERDFERINELLGQNEPDVEVVNNDFADGKIICENCGSDNVGYGVATKNKVSWWAAILAIILFVYPFKGNKCYHCYNCGHEFK
jgi:hypothetical protein